MSIIVDRMSIARVSRANESPAVNTCGESCVSSGTEAPAEHAAMTSLVDARRVA